MNPAQLLNPKAFAKEQAKAKKKAPNYGPTQTRKMPQPPSQDITASHAPLHLPSYDPKVLLGGKGGAGSSSNAGLDVPHSNGASNGFSQPSQNNGEDGQMGMSQFLPGFNNTVEREAGFVGKRNRQDDGEQDDLEHKKSKTAQNGTGGGGIVSEHLKEERKKQAADGAAVAIDLTGDDEDIVITGENVKPRHNHEYEEICIGVLTCKANTYRVPACGKSPIKELWPLTKITLKNKGHNIIELLDSRGDAFGRLSLNEATAFSVLLAGAGMSGFRIKPWLPMRDRKPDEVIGAPASRQIDVDCILYCQRSVTKTMGRFMSQRQLWLKKPKYGVDNNREIVNPQVPEPYRDQKIGNTVNKTSYGSTSTSYTTRTTEQVTRDVTNMFESLQAHESLPQKEADPELIATPLLSHQKQGLHFLTEHETYDGTLEDASESEKFSLWKRTIKVNGTEVWYNVITDHELKTKPEPVYGGILADMMGLGKTLSILSLVAATIKEARDFKKKRPSDDLKGVIRNAQGTLIVCPKSVLTNWTEQIGTHVLPNKLNCGVYHGTNRNQDVEVLAKCDIILTTYGTVASEYSDSLKKKKALAQLNWFRIVLDEAHTIRNPSTRAAKGACALYAQRRWAVTGTPVQNKLDDLGALIRFLRIKPFDDPGSWASHIIAPFKNADESVIKKLRLLVDTITLRRDKNKIDLPEKKVKYVHLTFSDEERTLYGQFASKSNMQLKSMLRESNKLRGKSYAHVLKSLLRLRMICDHGREMLNQDDLEQLQGMDASNAIDLGDEPELEAKSEKKFIKPPQAYELLKMQMDNEVDYCNGCSRRIVGGKKAQQNDYESESSSEDDDDDDELIGHLTPCYHLYCPKCKDKLVERTHPPEIRVDGYHDCEVCGAYVKFDFFDLLRVEWQRYSDDHAPGVKKIRQATWNPDTYSGPHTKVRALLNELDKSDDETRALPAGEPPIRSVVFTEWTSYLDLLEYALSTHGHNYVRLDGSMNVKARSHVLETFKSDPSVTVLLVSIRAGGQGLNFTAANKVYMMEPQYNPGVEQQAIDRVHRLGQKRMVTCMHFIMENSVEEALLKLQDKKQKLATLSMENDRKKQVRSEDHKTRMEELKDLFK